MECSESDANFFEYFKGTGPRPNRAEEGMIVSAGEFTGVPLATVLAQAGLTHKAAHVRAEGLGSRRARHRESWHPTVLL